MVIKRTKDLVDIEKKLKKKVISDRVTLSQEIAVVKKRTKFQINIERKQKKQVVLNKWLGEMVPNSTFMNHLTCLLEEKKEKDYMEYKFLQSMGCNKNSSDRSTTEVWSVLQDVLRTVELEGAEGRDDSSRGSDIMPHFRMGTYLKGREDSSLNVTMRDDSLQNTSVHYPIPPKVYGREVTWRYRAVICCFYYHPMLGNKKDTICSITFGIKAPTICGWATKTDMAPKWIVFTKELTVKLVIETIPKQYRSLDRYTKMSKSMLSSNFVKYLPNPVSSKQIYLCNSIDSVSSQKKVCLSNINNSMGNFTYVANNVHRIHHVDTNASKYTEHYQWIHNELSEHWRLGFFLTIEQLRHSISNKFPSFNDMKRNTYCQWVARAVKRAGYSDRKKSITQKCKS